MEQITLGGIKFVEDSSGQRYEVVAIFENPDKTVGGRIVTLQFTDAAGETEFRDLPIEILVGGIKSSFWKKVDSN